ncbi:unnamed protein product [Caenorhabditis auriculariae]|uniref:Uncharacterized protein n=1 Tax=Caenorhabditis auriculariae TaxID=2777116 RepID=A0A8S1HDB7_9PELO|nr:unnamed protein product [Caenorhabditis auriculariae]
MGTIDGEAERPATVFSHGKKTHPSLPHSVFERGSHTVSARVESETTSRAEEQGARQGGRLKFRESSKRVNSRAKNAVNILAFPFEKGLIDALQ